MKGQWGVMAKLQLVHGSAESHQYMVPFKALHQGPVPSEERITGVGKGQGRNLAP